MIKQALQKIRPNPLDRLLKKAQKKGNTKILLLWNRGLGDIALGLYAIVHKIREYLPAAEVTFLTRENLRDGFLLLGGVEILVSPSLRRGENPKVSELLAELDIDPAHFDLIIESPNPTQWVQWQRGTLTPRLHWQPEWEDLWKRFPLDPQACYVGAHVQTETNYAHWRNWPLSSWHELFEKVTQSGKKILLFGFEKTPLFEIPGVLDLRGDTPLFDLLSIIKNRCEALVVPDSGISSMVYYLDESFPIKQISLWADPYMGILKQNVSSPNPKLVHCPLLGENKDITTITPQRVYEELT